MQARISLESSSFEAAYRAMLGLGTTVRASGLDSSLLHLIRLRVSQLNGCGFCLDMHTKEARAAGETEQRLYLLQAWRDAPLFSQKERAALAWAEAVTRLTDGQVPHSLYNDLKAQFNESEMAALTLAIVEINGWNRFCISFNVTPGSYQVGQHG